MQQAYPWRYDKVFIIPPWSGAPYRSGCVMDCHASTLGLIPGGDSVKTELHVLCKGQ